MDSSHRTVLSTEVQYLRRRKSALWMTVSLLALALLVLTVGLISATRTDNVPVAGYYPGIIVSPSPHRILSHTFGSLNCCCKLLSKCCPPLKADCFCSCSLDVQLSFGAFLGIVGIHLVENRRPMVSLIHSVRRQFKQLIIVIESVALVVVMCADHLFRVWL